MSYEEFRHEVRSFLAANLTPELRRAGELTTTVFSDFDASLEWHRILYKQGWVAPDWPVEYGGTGWDINERYIFQEECKLANAPSLFALGLQMVGPMLMGYGSEAQKAKYLPRILSGEDMFCQGYSEPGAGSDLASLRCAAERDGDDYVINGQKTWTSMAKHANKMFLLVRTSKEGKPQAGITFLLLDDMSTEGLTIDPIVGLDGRVEQCACFFENVRIPVANRVGEENQGWAVAKYLLEFERGGHNYTIDLKKQIKKVREAGTMHHGIDGKPALANPVIASRLAELEVDALAVEYTELRLKRAIAGGGNPGALSSLAKLTGTELTQRFHELALDLLGPSTLLYQPEALEPGYHGAPINEDYALTTMPEYLNGRASTIYGGSAQVQRNIIAKLVLQLDS